MTFCVGTMNTETGWEVKSPENAAYLHFYYWFVSRKSQDKLIAEIPSFYHLWKTYGENRENLVENCNTFLTKYMQELFPDVTVLCNYRNVEGTSSLYHLVATVTVRHAGVEYKLAQLIEVRPEMFNLLERSRTS